MASTIGDILHDRSIEEPPEIQAIKAYVKKELRIVPQVSLRGETIVIAVPNAALAGSLRLQIWQLQKAAQTKKQLVIRIGQ